MMSAAPSPDHADRPRSLTDRVAFGAAWILGGRFVVRTLGLINTLILARLLAPGDFGLVAIGVTVMQLLENVSDIGVATTVVKYRNAGRSEYNTLFTISLLRGLAVAALLVIASLFADEVYDDQRMAAVFLALSIVPVFHGLMNPRFFEYERALDFSKEFWLAASNKLFGVVVSVSIALAFHSYWAIVLGLVAGAFLQTLMSWVLRPYRPGISLSALGSIGGFTGWLTGVSFVAALNNKLDVLILGRLVSPADVGAFFVGGSIASMPSGELATPMARAIYPGLAERQEEASNMREAYLRGVEAIAFIAMPASFGVAFLATELVALLLGDQWGRASVMLSYFAPALGVMTILSATNAYALAQGRAKLVFLREVVVFLFRTPVFVVSAMLYGLMGAALASAVGVTLITFLNAGLYARLSRRSPLEPFWRARRSFLGVAGMAVYFLFLRDHLSPISDAPLALRVAAEVIIGASIHFAVVLTAWRLESAPPGVERLALQRLSALRARFAGEKKTIS